MGERLHHRGPDKWGSVIEPEFGLGCRRLAIVDIAGGSQPLWNEQRTVVAVANGEIFNFETLRTDLERDGHVFSTRCDVEVLVHLYEELGTEIFKKLEGQYAVAIYDLSMKRLLLGVDEFGICPLFYAITGDGLYFASEVKALRAVEGVGTKLDLTTLDQVLSLPGPIAPRSMFADVQCLPPGHLLSVAGDQNLSIRKYWDLNFPRMDESLTYDEYDERDVTQKIRYLLEAAVKQRLQGDLPCGVYVSGGLDSSVVLGLAVKHSGNKVGAFNVGFESEEYDESGYAFLATQEVGVRLQRIIVGLDDIQEHLASAVYFSEIPLKETYNIASMLLARLVRSVGTKAVLCGEGADELFAGYSGYKLDQARGELSGSPDPQRGGLPIPYELSGNKNWAREQLYSQAVRELFNEFRWENWPVVDRHMLEERHVVNQRSYLDFKLRLAGHLLADHGDRMAMSQSVEVRFPFLSRRLVEYVSSLPPNLKLKGLQEKYILRLASRGLVPDGIRHRDKFPFAAPGMHFMLDTDFAQTYLSSDKLAEQGIFDSNAVKNLIVRYRAEGAGREWSGADLLLFVLTTTFFVEVYRLTV